MHSVFSGLGGFAVALIWLGGAAHAATTPAPLGNPAPMDMGGHRLPAYSITGNDTGRITYVGAASATAFNVNAYTIGHPTRGIRGVDYLGVQLSAVDVYNAYEVLTSDGASVSPGAATVTTFIDLSSQKNLSYGDPADGLHGDDGPGAYLSVYVSGSYFTQMTLADAGGIGFGPSTAAAGYFSPLNVTGSVLASVASGLPQQAGMLLALSVAALLVVRRKV